jgi:DNA replication protein DnaC
MSDEEKIRRDAERIALEKFRLAGRSPRERKPIIDALEWSDTYHPDLCKRCNGTGWMVRRDEERYGELVKCESCDVAKAQTIARCWKVSSMYAHTAKPPTITGFEPYTPEADVVLKAVNKFVRQPFGWFTLHGGSGTGKSHMTEAIARYFLTTNIACVFISSGYLWEYLGGVGRGEHDAVDYAERYRWICELPALVIDELNVEKSTEFVFKTRRNLLDARYRAAFDGRGVTVLASNDAPGSWQDAAIGDRALDTRFVAICTGSVSYRRIKRQTT